MKNAAHRAQFDEQIDPPWSVDEKGDLIPPDDVQTKRWKPGPKAPTAVPQTPEDPQAPPDPMQEQVKMLLKKGEARREGDEEGEKFFDGEACRWLKIYYKSQKTPIPNC